MKNLLVTGSAGLIGSEVASFFCDIGWNVHGIDNNQRMHLFGDAADTSQVSMHLQKKYDQYTHHCHDIRDRECITKLIADLRPQAIVHAAAQPSHDLAATIPFIDFEINAMGTLNLLNAARFSCPESPFIFLSTNKVYGDTPNQIKLLETNSRWDYADPLFINGIDESMSVDQCKHSLFGASKLAADILVQEYGRYFGMPTVCLRGGCLTGPRHKGVKLHGFLSYLTLCNLNHTPYTIFGFKGKQVRDNIHSYDVARLISYIIDSPKIGAVYNLGGGKDNSCSIIEAMSCIENITGKEFQSKYVDANRDGDHICYYTNLAKVKKDFPEWGITIPISDIINQIVKNFSEANSK